MTKITTQFLLIVAIAITSLPAVAYDFMVDGICYNTNTDGQSVTVTYQQRPQWDSSIQRYTPAYPSASGSLTVPEQVAHENKTYFVACIGDSAFEYCSGFTGKLSIPGSVTTIGKEAFLGCSGFTGQLCLPDSVTTIGNNAFAACSGFTGRLSLPSSLTRINDGVFNNCSGFTGPLIIPDSVTDIGYASFYGCSGLAGSLVIPESVTSIGGTAFSDCGFTGSLTIPNSVTVIGHSPFFRCRFTSIILAGEGSVKICETPMVDGYIDYMESLDYVYIKEGITAISGLRLSPSREVYCYATTPPECVENTFSYLGNVNLHVPCLSMTAYANHPYWGSKFLNIVDDAVEPEALKWDQDSVLLLRVDDQLTITPILTPNNTGLREVVMSSNPDVVSVELSYDYNAGRLVYTIQGDKQGEADIIAQCAWFEARCHVTVTGPSVPITLDKHEAEIWVGEMVSLTPNAPQELIYAVESSDSSVATARVVNGRVQVLGVKPGSAIITVDSSDGMAQPDSCLVSVIFPRGDVTKNGVTDVDDLNAMINVILDFAVSPEADDFSYYDLSCNGTIGVEDINRLINILLDFPEAAIYTVYGISFKMVPVAGGTFTMGGTAEQGDDAMENESPAHQVTLSNYCIGETEVTQELWLAVMGSNPSVYNGSNYGNNLKRPVEHVSWNDCQTFITKLNQLTGQHFRLPTEAEWEYAARGGNQSQGYKYAGGNSIGNVAWYIGNTPAPRNGIPGTIGTQTVATKAPNELGLYDMSGNVWEWCQDLYGNYGSNEQANPAGPTSGSYRVVRSGGFSSYANYCRVSFRSYSTVGTRNSSIGFRIAQ